MTTIHIDMQVESSAFFGLRQNIIYSASLDGNKAKATIRK